MMLYDWNREKNEWLRKNRNICFEDILFCLDNDLLIDDIAHSNQERYAGLRMMVFNIEEYIYFVPYVEYEDGIFLMTIIPGRKETRNYLEKKR
jgi:uncharacterized DUF497 family protein